MQSPTTSFVIQVERAPAGEPRHAASALAGRVENLDSGESCRFRSARELLRFLRGPAVAPPSGPPSGPGRGRGAR